MQLRLFQNEFPRDQVVEIEPTACDNNYDASIAYRKKWEADLARMQATISGFLYDCAARSAERNYAMWQRYGGY
jgi:hypothetical protein